MWAFLSTCAIAGSLVLMITVGILPVAFGIVAVAIVLTTVFWLLRAHLPSIMLVFVSALLVSVVATQRLPKLRPDRMEAEEGERLSRKWQASGRFDQNLPIVVHLIFDELMSVGAMTDDLPDGSRTRALLLEFGAKHSFRTFDSVYSRYWYTGETIPHLMNREYLGRTGMDSFFHPPFDAKAKTYHVEDNAYFDEMSSRGYRTAVFQNSYMDFCANKSVDQCETFDSFDPAWKDSAGVDSPTLRVSLWRNVLRAYSPSFTSQLGEKILDRVYALGPNKEGLQGFDGGRYDAHRFPEWFDRFTRFTAAVPRGTHVFAHFLVPHAPYVLLESCVVSGKVDNGYFLSRQPHAEQAGMRRDFYERYLGQVRCVENKLDHFMAAINRSENFRDAVIIIHGDHGSRISSGDLIEDYTERDFVDNYGAFFAIRSPFVPAGVDCEFVSLPEIFRRYAAQNVEKRSGQALPVVVLSRRTGNPKLEAPMPLFGCAAGAASLSP